MDELEKAHSHMLVDDTVLVDESREIMKVKLERRHEA